MKRYPNLDILRLFAALEVFAVHAFNVGHSRRFDPSIQPVPLFVCLSGFLIPGSFERSANWLMFAWKRACRVVPAFVVSLGLVACISGPASLGGTLAQYLTLGLLGISANGVLWSLSVEELLYGFHATTRAIRHLWRTETVLTCFLLSCIWAGVAVNADVRRIPQAAAAFFLGNVAYLNRKRLSQIGWIYPAIVSVCILLAFQFWIARPLGLVHVAFEITRSSLCLAVVLTAWRLPQIKWEFPDLSYGLYVYHRPLLSLFAIGGSVLAGAPRALAASLILSAASFYLVEKPALKLKNRPWQLPKKAPEPRAVEAVA